MTVATATRASRAEPIKLGRVRLVKTTARAMLIVRPSGVPLWVPLSAVHPDSQLYGRKQDGELTREQDAGMDGVLVVKRWWAQARGWCSDARD